MGEMVHWFVSTLKIDGSFVRGIDTDSVDLAMVRAVNDIGTTMGKRIIAECVESQSVLDTLRSLGVAYAQGFAIGRPAPLETLLPV